MFVPVQFPLVVILSPPLEIFPFLNWLCILLQRFMTTFFFFSFSSFSFSSSSFILIFPQKTGNNRLTRSTVSFEQEEEKKRNIFDDIANEVFGGDEGDLVIAINSTTYQSMIGFGGALTDAGLES